MENNNQIAPMEMDIHPLIDEGMDDIEKSSRPPTANELAMLTMHSLRAMLKGKLSIAAADSVHKGVGNVVRQQANKLSAAKYSGRPLHKDLLHELSVKIVK